MGRKHTPSWQRETRRLDIPWVTVPGCYSTNDDTLPLKKMNQNTETTELASTCRKDRTLRTPVSPENTRALHTTKYTALVPGNFEIHQIYLLNLKRFQLPTRRMDVGENKQETSWS